mgnify:CR=1 FL=1
MRLKNVLKTGVLLSAFLYNAPSFAQSTAPQADDAGAIIVDADQHLIIVPRHADPRTHPIMERILDQVAHRAAQHRARPRHPRPD